MNSGAWTSLIFVLFHLTMVTGTNDGRAQLERKILHDILLTSRFNQYVRPSKSADQVKDKPTDVIVNFYVLNLDVDDKNQECTLQMYFRQKWNDSRLSYNDQGKIDILTLHDTIGLWTPDLFFVNEKLGHLHELTKPNTCVRIFPNGQVAFSQRLSIKFTCKMDLRKYPFDTQICVLLSESYAYSTKDLMLKWDAEFTKGISEAPGFQIFYSTEEEIIHLPENSYSRLKLNIHLTRLKHLQVIHVYIPLGFLVVASWISFCLRPSRHVPRLAAILVITFTTLTFVQSAKEFFYPSSYLTALDVWVGFSCLIIFAAVFENVYVISYHKNKPLAFQENGISNKKDVPELPNEGENKRGLIGILKGKLSAGESNVDAVARLMFPSVFVLFNVIYMAYYLK